MHQLSRPLGPNEKLLLKACADSVYFGSHNFHNVVKACGSRCAYTIKSLTSRTNSTSGSRFAMDNRQLLNDPITGRGHKLLTVNLSRVPNIEVARCHLNEIPGHDMPIYLHWLGLSRVRETNYFTNQEAAVINLLLNATRLNLVQSSEDREESTTEELAKIKLFETKVKGASSSFLKSKKYHLGCSAMSEFSDSFMEMLEYFSSLDQDAFDFAITSFMTGMTIEEDSDAQLNPKRMRAFCHSLQNNCYFCASLAGCKRTFHNKPAFCHKLESPEQLSMAHIESVVTETTAEIYRVLREEFFVIDGWPRNRNDGKIQYHFDFGLEFSPLKEDDTSFLLCGNKARLEFQKYLAAPRPNVPYLPDPRTDRVTLRDFLDGDDTDSEDDNSQDLTHAQILDANSEVGLMNQFDQGLYELGEVHPPQEARLIGDEGSDDEEGKSPPISGFVFLDYKSRNPGYFGICFLKV
jgi:hypothetical protein